MDQRGKCIGVELKPFGYGADDTLVDIERVENDVRKKTPFIRNKI